MNNSKAEMFLERVEVVVAVEEVMPLGQTESGDQAIDRLADGVALLAQVPAVLSGSNSQFAPASLENVERQSNSRTSCSSGLLHTGANDWRCSGVGPYSNSAAKCCGVL